MEPLYFYKVTLFNFKTYYMLQGLFGFCIGICCMSLMITITARHNLPAFKHIDLPDPCEIRHINTDKNNREPLFGYQAGDTLYIQYK